MEVGEARVVNTSRYSLEGGDSFEGLEKRAVFGISK